MATQQTEMSRGNKNQAQQPAGGARGAEQRGAGQRNAPGAGESAQRAGGETERDEVYGAVSVLYHALQGAETYGKYIEDARAAGDDELVEFFQSCREEEQERAQRAKSLLIERLEETDEDESGSEDEDEDEEDEE